MIAKIFLGVKGGQLINLTFVCEPTVEKVWGPRRLTTLWVSMACYRYSLIFYDWEVKFEAIKEMSWPANTEIP
jgi:hypothetical protein